MLTLYNTPLMAGMLPRWVRVEDGLDPSTLFPWRRHLLSTLRPMSFAPVHIELEPAPSAPCPAV